MEHELSIIIAVEDDNELNIKKTVESALGQSYEKTVTIICADNASDKTRVILSEFQKNNPEKCEVYYTTRFSARGGAFNLGLRKAVSEWICFVNEGDILSNDFADKMISEAKKSGADVVACGYTVFDPEKSEGPEKRDDGKSGINDSDYEIETEILKEAVGKLDYDGHAILCVNPGRMESKIFKKKIFDVNGLWFPEEISFEKLGIHRLALFYADKFAFVSDRLYSYSKQSDETALDGLYERIDVMSFFMEETYKREFLEDYPEEVESAFIDDLYVKTLFMYLAITPPSKRDISFLKMLSEAVLDCFPEFETNPYYYEKYDGDIKELLNLHISNPKKFMKLTAKMRLN